MRRIKGVVAIILVALLCVFIFSNTHAVTVKFLTIHVKAPISILVLFSSVAGVALWPLLRTFFERSKK